MKSVKAAFKSNKILVNKNSKNKNLQPNVNYGETLIPIGSDDLFVKLPNLSNTYSYNIINADEMTGNITLKTSRGASLKGLMLRSNGGSLSIDPIQTGTDELTLESDVKDGCYIQTLSNGSEWFIWSVATGGTISVRTGGVITTHTPTPPPQVYADITNVVITSDVRFVGGGLEARHDLVLSGEGEPGASLTISETTGNSDAALVFPVTIQIAQDGTWELNKNTLATNLPNGRYEFDFTPTLGNGVQGVVFNENTGAINFTVPSTFTPDPAEVVDFASGASAVKPDGTQIAVAVDSSAWNSSLVHGDTFDIIYSITDPAVNGGNPVTQTVTGTIVDDTPPAAPSFIAASIANINELSANGTAEPNKTITLFQDSLPLSPTVTSDGAGFWSFGPVVLNFNSNFTLKAQASEAGVGNPNRSAFGEYSPAFNYVQPVTPAPTIGVNGEQTSVWTNTANSLTLSGTTEIGATIEVLDGANPATLVSGPTVDGAGNWSATIDVANESVTSLSAKATLAGHLTSQAASFQLNVDRVPPAITLTGGAQTVGLPNVGASLDLGFSVSDASSGVATETSDWDSVVSTTTEGTYTVTYNATDVAGNPAIAVTRDVTVTTEVIVPVITNITANVDGTFTVEGTVTGTFADNLTVQVTIGGSNSGTPVAVTSGAFTHTTSAVAPGTYEFKAKSINSAAQESSLSGAETATISVPDTTAPVMTITNTDTGLELSDGDTVNLVDGDAFNFTAVTDDGSPVVIAQGGSPVSSGTTFTTGTYSVTFDSTDGVNAASTITITLEVVAAANFIEDIQSVINRAAGQANISIVNGIVIDTNQNSPSHGLNVRLADDGIVAYDSLTGETVNDEFTISFWANLDSQGDNTYFMGTNSGRRLYFYLGGTTNATFRLGWSDGTSNFQHFALNAGTFTSWTHFVLTVEKTSTNIALSVYINGSKLSIGQSQTAPLGTKILPPLANQVIKFGGVEGITGQTKSVSGQFDSIQIGDGIALSADQILWISQDSLRQRSIAGALAAINTAPSIALNGDSNLFHPLGQSFNDPGATAQDQADGDLTSSIQTTIVNSQGGSVSAIDATSPEDTYTITYSVTDSGGLSATVTRTVLVSAVITTSSLLTTQTVTLNGGATLTNGILDLPNTNGDYASIVGSSNYDPSGGITYSAWVYLDTLKNQQGILSNIFSTTSWDGFTMQFQKNNTYPNGFVVVACNGSSDATLSDVPVDSSNNPVAITTGVWHFLAVTFNPTGGECIAYFNGVALNQTLSGAQIAHNNNWPFYIGTQRDSSNQLTVNGQIQGVRIEQTIKSASQLLATYNAGPQ